MRMCLLVFCTVLSACVGRSEFPPLSSLEAEGGLTQASRVQELTAGMTQAEVHLIVGGAVASVDDPDRVGQTCFSHPYGPADDPRFIHVVYLGGHLSRASDGHVDLCTVAAF